MTRIAKQLTELIGSTPLLELGKFSAANNLDTPIVAKIESFNPGGSVKDRIALAMIAYARCHHHRAHKWQHRRGTCACGGR